MVDNIPQPTPAQLAYVLNPKRDAVRGKSGKKTRGKDNSKNSKDNSKTVQRGMTRAMFNQALMGVFGSALGQSLYQDLLLTEYGLTASAALMQGAEPLEVWHALLRESGRDSAENMWWHRQDLPKDQ